MTIAQLLSANGAQVPRYITVNGRTVFGNVTSTPGGLVHPDHGPVTRVANHTFHGGEDPVDTGDQPWWRDDDGIVRHIHAMEKAFPGFVYVHSEDNPPSWVGTIDTGRGVFTIGVLLRRDEGLPSIFVISKQRLGVDVNGRFRRAPHLYDSGHLCVADQSDWDAVEHTAATATAWAAHWLAAFTEWRFTQKWPVDGVHGAA